MVLNDITYYQLLISKKGFLAAFLDSSPPKRTLL